MKVGKRFLTAVVAISFFIAGGSAHAAILNLAIDPSQSTMSESIGVSGTFLGQTASANSGALTETLSGGAPGLVSPPAHTGYLGSVGIAGNVPGTLVDQGGGFGITNLSTSLSIPILGGFSLSLMVPHVSIGLDGPFSPSSSGANTATYNVSGLPLQFDAGIFNYSFTGLLAGLGSGSIPLLTDLGSQSLPTGSLATLNLSGNHVSLSVPLNMTAPLLTIGDTFFLGAGVILTFAGTAVFTGVIPEPSSIVLLGIGMVAATPLVARRLRRRG